jgi:hypothetical protein
LIDNPARTRAERRWLNRCLASLCSQEHIELIFVIHSPQSPGLAIWPRDWKSLKVIQKSDLQTLSIMSSVRRQGEARSERLAKLKPIRANVRQVRKGLKCHKCKSLEMRKRLLQTISTNVRTWMVLKLLVGNANSLIPCTF